jgi:hypothetical protein
MISFNLVTSLNASSPKIFVIGARNSTCELVEDTILYLTDIDVLIL